MSAEARDPLRGQDMSTVPEEWSRHIQQVLWTEAEIQARVKELAAEISREYAGKKFVGVVLLKGGFVFAADILRHVTVPHDVDFLTLSSYGSGTVSSGEVVMKKDLCLDPEGKHLLILEDLIDTGNTLDWLLKHLGTQNCASVKIACLLNKKARRQIDIPIDFCGWDCPDEFVVGYGMDFGEEYRCLPFVGVLHPNAYTGGSSDEEETEASSDKPEAEKGN